MEPLYEFAEKMAGVLTAAGLPRMPARVLMALFVTPDASLTAPQLCERLGISAAAVSGAVRYLETIGMVRRRTVAGSRRELYELPEDSWYTASLRANPVYGAMLGLLPEGVAAAREREDGASIVARLDEMSDFFSFVSERMPVLLAEWKAARAAPGAGPGA